MDPFKVGHDKGESWLDIADSCLRQVGQVEPGDNLGFVYLTDALAANGQDLVDYLRAQTGVRHWVGCVGMGICATGQEYYEQPAIALMVASFAEDSFRLFQLRQDLDTLHRDQADWLAQHPPWFGVVHGNPGSTQLESLLRSLSGQMVSGVVTGGLASSARDAAPSIADNMVTDGLSGVVFTDTVQVSTRLSQGCRPIGERHLVTECDENILISIDQRPALDVFKEDIGETLARDVRRVGGYIFAGLPIAGSDRGEYLVRNLMGLDQDQGLLAIGARVEQGDSVLFCKRDADSALEDLQHMLDDLVRSLDGRTVRGAIYVSCLGRGVNLFGPDSTELKLIAARLGPVPLVGFYANGEISGDRIYGYTGILTVFL